MPRSRSDGTPPQPPNRYKLTELLVKRQKPRARAFMIWDTLQRGFALSVQPTGHKAYKVVYSHHGRVRWLHLGSVNAIGLSDARKLANRVMLQVAEGQDPQAERNATRSAPTFYRSGRSPDWLKMKNSECASGEAGSRGSYSVKLKLVALALKGTRSSAA
jgi:Arm DNA-binding domain